MIDLLLQKFALDILILKVIWPYVLVLVGVTGIYIHKSKK